MSDDYQREIMAIDYAIARAAKAGMSIEDVRREVEFAIETLAADNAFGPAAEVRD